MRPWSPDGRTFLHDLAGGATAGFLPTLALLTAPVATEREFLLTDG